MPAACIFCNNDSGSREHLWPDWLLKRHKFGPIKMQLGDRQRIVKQNPDLKVKTVCGTFNNGWMSSLESSNIPIIGPMSDGISTTLDTNAQTRVAAWSFKGAMMSDSMRGRQSGKFYTRNECASMRDSHKIPADTLVWIGKVDGKHIANIGTDFTYNDDKGTHLATNCLCTIAAGHFVVQVVSVHAIKSA